MPHFVYGIIEAQSGELRYVGKTCQKLQTRLKRHIAEARRSDKVTHKLNWLREQLNNNCIPKIFLIEEHATATEAFSAEVELIAYYKSLGCSLVNSNAGGLGGLGYKHSTERIAFLKSLTGTKSHRYRHKHTQESKELMSINRKGIARPASAIEAQRKAILGHKMSEYNKQKLAEANKLQKGKNHPWYGKKHSETTKVKLKAAKRYTKRAVRLLETGEVFEGIVDASIATGARYTGIARCCYGNIKSTNGLHFEFVKEAV
jgi:Uri superfamily endonuclease